MLIREVEKLIPGINLIRLHGAHRELRPGKASYDAGLVFFLCLAAALSGAPRTAAIPRAPAEPAQVDRLEGTCTFIKDSDGTQAPANARIMLTFSNGTAVLVSDPPQPRFTDSGSYEFQAGTLKRFILPRLGKFVMNGTVSLQGDVLTLPFKLMSGGQGSSEWKAPTLARAPASVRTLENVRSIAHKVRTRLDLDLAPGVKTEIQAAVNQLGPERSQGWLHMGTELNLAGQVDEAAWTLAKGVELKPDDPQLLNNFGHLLGLAFDYENAHLVLLAAREVAPQNPYILANLAYTAFQLKRYDEAEMAEEAAVAGNPTPENYWSLCKILHAKHDARAEEACQKAQDLGIVAILHPGANKPSGGGGGNRDGGAGPPAPDRPPGPDNTPEDRRPDLEAPAGNEDEGAKRAAVADPDSSIYGQIGKRDPSNDQQPPRPYKYPPAQGEINKNWVGHWEGFKTTGCIHRTRKFGQGPSTTYVHENICHYAQKLSLEVNKDGAISGRGEAVYVFYGKADNMAMMMMMPLPMPPGGFFATFPGGYRVRKFDVGGRVLPDGRVYIGGRPEKEMYLLNIYEFQKIYGWNVFPPPADNPGAPGELRISKQGERWAMVGERENKVSGMKYETTIFKSDRPFSMVKGCKILCAESGAKKSSKNECQYSVKQGPVEISGSGEELSAKIEGPGGSSASISSSGAASGKVQAGAVGAGINVGAGGETLGADMSLGGLGINAEANYGKPGELQKAIAAEKLATCGSEGPKVGTMKFGMSAGNASWSTERNPISGDESFSIGASSKMKGALGKLGTGASADVRLIVSSKCGVAMKFKVETSEKMDTAVGGASGGCSHKDTLERTVMWGQSNIAE